VLKTPPGTLFLIAAIAVLSPILATAVKRWVRIPALVFEILLGIVIGAQVLNLASITPAIGFPPASSKISWTARFDA